MTKIETILFDLDGTLIDSRADLTNAVNHALTSVKLAPLSQEDVLPHVGNGMRVLLSEVLGPVSDELLESAICSFGNFYREHCVDHTVPYDGVKEGLAALTAHGRVGVVTNKPEYFSRRIIERLGLSKFVSVIVGGDSSHEKKPHPAPVLKAIRDMKSHTESALMVGDGIQDIQAGHAAGLRTCVARYGFGFHIESLDLKPNFQIRRFLELLDLKEIVS